ncbi:MAG: hypothetical protein FWF81_06445 [Defluviitaleaceae bacterium]|nr:hypothetical protein [Defluviitaleaceae bacterium]
MYSITEQMLALESDAQEAMKDIEKEIVFYTKNMQDSLAKRITEIESDGAETIKRLISETEKHTAARISQVQEEYLKKTTKFEKDFRLNEKKLRGKIFHDILQS